MLRNIQELGLVYIGNHLGVLIQVPLTSLKGV